MGVIFFRRSVSPFLYQSYESMSWVTFFVPREELKVAGYSSFFAPLRRTPYRCAPGHVPLLLNCSPVQLLSPGGSLRHVTRGVCLAPHTPKGVGGFSLPRNTQYAIRNTKTVFTFYFVLLPFFPFPFTSFCGIILL